MAHVPISVAQYSGGRSVLASLRLAVLTFLADPQWLIPSMIAPIVFGLVSFGLFLNSGPYFLIYAILGAGMMSMWGQTLYGCGWATGRTATSAPWSRRSKPRARTSTSFSGGSSGTWSRASLAS